MAVKTLKTLAVAPFSKIIYLTHVNEEKHLMVGKREDFTDKAIAAVFEWFMRNFEDNEPNVAFEIRYANCPYVLRMIKEEKKETEREVK